MPVTDKTLRLMRRLRIDLEAVTEGHVKELTRAYADAWDVVVDELREALLDLAEKGELSRTAILRSSRVASALQAIADQLDQLAATTAVVITDGAGQVTSIAVTTQAAIAASQLPAKAVGIQLATVNADVIGTIVARTGQQITARTRPLPTAAMQAINEALVRGAARADNPVKVARRMVALARDAGVDLPLRRAEAISRTELLDAARQAQQAWDEANTATLAGWEWLSARDTRTCPACWAKDGTLHQLWEPGPWGHVNCLTGDVVVSGPPPRAATTRWYDGEVVEVETVRGNHLTVTPNHPVLTTDGWVEAGRLHEGSHVVSAVAGEGDTSGTGPHDYQVPARAEDVAEAFGRAFPMLAVTVPGSPVDFHGDGAAGEVHVVRADRLLSHIGHAPLFEPPAEPQFQRGHMLGLPLGAGLAGEGTADQLVVGPPHASHGGVGGGGVTGVLLRAAQADRKPVCVGLRAGLDALTSKPPVNGVAGYSVALRQGVDRLARAESGGDLLVRERQHVAAGLAGPEGVVGDLVAPQAALDQRPAESLMGYAVPSRSDLAAHVGEVVADCVLKVRRRSFSGHVYNFQTDTEWYLAGGIVTHNCRCTRMVRTKTWRELGIDLDELDDGRMSAEDHFRSLSRDEQLQIMGPSRLKALDDGAAWDSLATLVPNPDWRPSWQQTPVSALAS